VTVVVTSAGTHARTGDAAETPMLDICETWGLDITPHRSFTATGLAHTARARLLADTIRQLGDDLQLALSA
jgi:protein-tyrosine-phosphatase